MTPRLGSIRLLAEREFKTYVATVSFWIALLLGPLLIAAAGAAVALNNPGPVTVRIVASDPELRAAASASLDQAGRFERRALTESTSEKAAVTLRVMREAQTVTISSSDPAIPSLPAQAFIRAAIERNLAIDALQDAGLPPPRTVWLRSATAEKDAGAALVRLGLVLVLWTTLTGSLGMLLQATVRERANRSLESLLSAATPMEIVIGKLLGIGAVSVLVLGAWLGSSLGLASLTPASSSMGDALAALVDPVALLRTAALYLLAFGLFGMATIAVGSVAQDSAGAQNQARPMFAVLLVVFFVCIQSVMGGGSPPAWLVYLPPFTPFVLLLEPVGATTQVVAILLLLSGAVAAAFWAAHGLAHGRLLAEPRLKAAPRG